MDRPADQQLGPRVPAAVRLHHASVGLRRRPRNPAGRSHAPGVVERPAGLWASSEANRRVMQANRSRTRGPSCGPQGGPRSGPPLPRRDAPGARSRVRADLVFSGSRVAVFIDGCFCGCARTPRHRGRTPTTGPPRSRGTGSATPRPAACWWTPVGRSSGSGSTTTGSGAPRGSEPRSTPACTRAPRRPTATGRILQACHRSTIGTELIVAPGRRGRLARARPDLSRPWSLMPSARRPKLRRHRRWCSSLVDGTLDLGLKRVAVVDISEAGLAVAQTRLGRLPSRSN